MSSKSYAGPKTRIPTLGEDGDKHRIMLASHGIPASVPAKQVRAHLKELVDIGIRPNMIARAAGVSRGVPERILNGSWSKVSIRHASALMGVSHMPHPEQKWMPNIGVARRIQALRAYGWSVEALSKRLGYQSPTEAQTIESRPLVTYQTWKLVHDLYEEVSTIHGGSNRAANHASRQGWLLPMEWEGYDIDDPRVMAPRARKRDAADQKGVAADRRAEVLRLTRAGLSETQIAERIGCSTRTVARDRKAA